MYLNCVLIIVVTLANDVIYSVIADKEKYETLNRPSTLASLPDETRLINFKERSEKGTKKRQNVDNDNEKIQDSRQEKNVFNFAESLRPDGGDDHQCCGSRYDVVSPVRPETRHQESNGGSPKDLSDNGRYPSRYGSHPEDRFGWQSYNPGNPGRRGAAASSASSSGSGLGPSGGGLYGTHSGGDRYGGSKPSYYGGDIENDRPSNSGNRPGRPSYGHGGNGQADNGAYGGNGYEVNRPGGYGVGRPPGGLHFGGGRPGPGSYGGGRPGAGSYGSGSYAGAGHGVYGTIGEEEDYPGQNEGPEAGDPPPNNNHLQTQKAVALKALAGVALIGAAAALATNPVLLPIGILAGRRRRSVYDVSDYGDIDSDRLIELLNDNVPKLYKGKIRKQVLASPTCIARLACEIQRKYAEDIKKKNIGNENGNNVYDSLRIRLMNLFKSKAYQSDVYHKNMKKLLKSAEAYDGNCNVFVCEYIKN